MISMQLNTLLELLRAVPMSPVFIVVDGYQMQ